MNVKLSNKKCQIFQKNTMKCETKKSLLLKNFESEYHEDGHLHVGYCQGGNAPMVYSQVSARDPIFWRWHKHISNFIREMTNRILPG